MPRKNPRTTESEREQAYRSEQRVGRGEKVQGEEAEFLDDAGEVGEVRRGRKGAR